MAGMYGGKLPKPKMGKMKTGPIDAHRITAAGTGGYDATHGKHNRSHGLPADMYGQGGKGYMEGPSHGNCKCY